MMVFFLLGDISLQLFHEFVLERVEGFINDKRGRGDFLRRGKALFD